MRKLFLSFVCFLTAVLTSVSGQSQSFTFSGFVRESGSLETLIGVTVYLPSLQTGSVSNTYGFYSVSVPKVSDSLEVIFSMVGYKKQAYKLSTAQDLKNFDIELVSNNELEGVVVLGPDERQSQSATMSKLSIPIQQIKEIPALLGEKDVLKVLQLMPGVQSGSEGNSGLYVRGGGPDQNLIILDDAIVYNAFHLFGFFSLFNGDAIKSVELIKGGFPARYGGRISSVLDINLKDGNKEKIKGEGGIGIIASRFVLEGPIQKKKSSFIVSARRTYIDALIQPFLSRQERGGYYFYDFNAKTNFQLGAKDKIYLSGYFGEDKFYFNTASDDNRMKGGFEWGNGTGTLRWNHVFNKKCFANLSVIYSNYQFGINVSEKEDDYTFNLDYKSGIRDWGLKYDLEYAASTVHNFRFGVASTAHRFTPSAVVYKDNQDFEFKDKKNIIDVIESGIYIEDTYTPSRNFTANLGFRLSAFQYKETQYFKPEPRISLAYLFNSELSLKGSFSQMNQYVHLLSNTGVGLPTDLWVPSTTRVKPQTSTQYALGIAKDIPARRLSFTAEAYYKISQNVIGYKEGASFLLLDDPTSNDELSWQSNITAGQAQSYGIELLLQRKVGKFSGWLGYTLSWTQLQFDSLNFGKWFYARYDRRHDAKAVLIYKPNKSFTFSAVWVYGTGNAITLPLANYNAVQHDPVNINQNSQNFASIVEEFGQKNGFRMKAYHRMDLSAQFHRKHKRYESTWEISAYNVYNRRNPFFYYIDSGSNNQSVLKQITLFPIIPSVSYSFKF
ncbi:MAG: TonB-dependent receptor [Cytophagales bacterium]|nr:MAG: TonB-dependent receptor [Cytophagales bacterium]TAF60305.1 MAG: TonB-dependent receptor [Cytophagales bacterium]